MKVVFFCGHKSRYGKAHLMPLLQSEFKITDVILANDSRWKTFKTQLGSESELRKYQEKKIVYRLKQTLISLKNTFTDYRRGESFPIKKYSKKYGFNVHFINDVNSKDFNSFLENRKPDLILSAAYPQIFGNNLLTIPVKGAVNFHPSLLPKFRGAHPHFWVVLEGANETGVTAHYMTEKIDSGDIVAQKSFTCKNLTYNQVYQKLIEYTPKLIDDVESFFLHQKGKAWSQDNSQATFYNESREIHRRIFWRKQRACKIINMSRTQQCFFFLKGKKFILKKAEFQSDCKGLTNKIQSPNGTIVDISDNGAIVKCKEGFVAINQISYKFRTYHFLKWLDKYNLDIGCILE